MAELLLRVVDKPLSGDLKTDVMRTMRGDVITVQKDGWKWSPRELNNPAWRIIAFPGAPVSEFNGMLQRELGDPKVNFYLQRRGVKYYIDSLPSSILTAINKAPGSLIIIENKAEFDAIRLTRQSIDDPAVL